jgi:hypothetical protein
LITYHKAAGRKEGGTLTNMIAENSVIVLERPFAERIIVIEIVVERLAKEIL